MIVFDSADMDSAVEGVVDAIWFNQGQVREEYLHGFDIAFECFIVVLGVQCGLEAAGAGNDL